MYLARASLKRNPYGAPWTRYGRHRLSGGYCGRSYGGATRRSSKRKIDWFNVGKNGMDNILYGISGRERPIPTVKRKKR